MSQHGSNTDAAPKSREEVIDQWVHQQTQVQRKKRKEKRGVEDPGGVTITSLMDAMTIILVFLLMNYTVDPIKVDGTDDLKLPPSITDVNPQPTAALTVTKAGIVLNDKMVVQVKEGTVDLLHKQGDEKSMQIQPLFEALNEEAGRQKEMARLSGRTFEGELTIIADETTPYRLITEVLYTSGQAEFQKFRFAVLKGARRAQ